MRLYKLSNMHLYTLLCIKKTTPEMARSFFSLFKDDSVDCITVELFNHFYN